MVIILMCSFEGIYFICITFIFLDGSMVEHTAVNRGVVGSSPTRGVCFLGSYDLNKTTDFELYKAPWSSG